MQLNHLAIGKEEVLVKLHIRHALRFSTAGVITGIVDGGIHPHGRGRMQRIFRVHLMIGNPNGMVSGMQDGTPMMTRASCGKKRCLMQLFWHSMIVRLSTQV